MNIKPFKFPEDRDEVSKYSDLEYHQQFQKVKTRKVLQRRRERTHFPRKKPGYSQVPRERVRERSCYTSRRWIRRSEFILIPAGVEDKGDEGWEELRKQYEKQFGIEPEQEGKSNSKKRNVIIKTNKSYEAYGEENNIEDEDEFPEEGVKDEAMSDNWRIEKAFMELADDTIKTPKRLMTME